MIRYDAVGPHLTLIGRKARNRWLRRLVILFYISFRYSFPMTTRKRPSETPVVTAPTNTSEEVVRIDVRIKSYRAVAHWTWSQTETQSGYTLAALVETLLSHRSQQLPCALPSACGGFLIPTAPQ